jgi:hypothetical protein
MVVEMLVLFSIRPNANDIDGVAKSSEQRVADVNRVDESHHVRISGLEN